MSPDEILDHLLSVDPLSILPRTGWLMNGVQPAETIAEHCFGVAYLAMLLSDELAQRGEAVDCERVLRMALLHDVAEVRTGDIPMPQKTPEIDAALHHLESEIVKKILPPRYREYWLEAERGESLESRIVKAADKLQMMAKVHVYERQRGASLEEYWQNPANFKDRGLPLVREIFEAIARRSERELPAGC